MANPTITHPALIAQKTQPKQSNTGFCVSCQLGEHCGSCFCCRSHHAEAIPQSWYTINTGAFTASVDRESGEISYEEA